MSNENKKLNYAFTPVPREHIDKYMCVLSGSQWKVLMAIVRKIQGFGKSVDGVSYSQIHKLTGIKSPKCISRAIKSLEEKCLISCSRSPNRTTRYTVHIPE